MNIEQFLNMGISIISYHIISTLLEKQQQQQHIFIYLLMIFFAAKTKNFS